MRLLRFFLALTTFFSLESGCFKRYDNYSLARVVPQTAHQLQVLEQIDKASQFDFWRKARQVGGVCDVLVEPWKLLEWKKLMSHHRIPIDIINENVQSLLDKSTNLETELKSKRSDYELKYPITTYPDYSQMENLLGMLALMYEHCELMKIGKTQENRNVYVVKLSKRHTGKHKKAIFINAGFHAREWIAPITAINLILKLCEDNSEVKKIFKYFDLYIVPMANPDGYEYSKNHDRLWRKNRSRHGSGDGCYGTDLNRNWNFHWQEVTDDATSDESCNFSYRGPRPFSEAETDALSKFIIKNKEHILAFFDVHSYGQLVMTPWGFSMTPPRDFENMKSKAESIVKAIQRATGYKYKFGVTSKVLYMTSGTADDWAKGVANINLSYTIELRDTGTYGFLLPENQIEPTSQEFIAAIFAFCNNLVRGFVKILKRENKRDEVVSEKKEVDLMEDLENTLARLENNNTANNDENLLERVKSLKTFENDLRKDLLKQQKNLDNVLKDIRELKNDEKIFKETYSNFEEDKNEYLLRQLKERVVKVEKMFGKAVKRMALRRNE